MQLTCSKGGGFRVFAMSVSSRPHMAYSSFHKPIPISIFISQRSTRVLTTLAIFYPDWEMQETGNLVRSSDTPLGSEAQRLLPLQFLAQRELREERHVPSSWVVPCAGEPAKTRLGFEGATTYNGQFFLRERKAEMLRLRAAHASPLPYKRCGLRQA